MVLGYENSLTIIRGDSDSLTVTCTNPDKTIHPLVEGDIIYFSLKDSIKDEEFSLQKSVSTFTPEGKAVVELTHEDTMSLTSPQYKYSVQLRRADDTVSTLAYGNFMVKEVVNFG